VIKQGRKKKRKLCTKETAMEGGGEYLVRRIQKLEGGCRGDGRKKKREVAQKRKRLDYLPGKSSLPSLPKEETLRTKGEGASCLWGWWGVEIRLKKNQVPMRRRSFLRRRKKLTVSQSWKKLP